MLRKPLGSVQKYINQNNRATVVIDRSVLMDETGDPEMWNMAFIVVAVSR